jgi:hypothetical protein
MTKILSADRWPSNAELIEDCVRLGYLNKRWLTMDPTFGDGIWWKNWQPDELVKHDKYKLDGVDFRDLPEDNCTYDAITYDPPYVSKGGRDTSGIPEMDGAYGLEEAPESPEKLQMLIDDGTMECTRVLAPGGLLLVKCKNYTSSGKLWPGEYLTQKWAMESCGLTIVDIFDHVGNPGPQPKTRKIKHQDCEGKGCPGCEGDGFIVTETEQKHAAHNSSTLFVFRKPGRRRKLRRD